MFHFISFTAYSTLDNVCNTNSMKPYRCPLCVDSQGSYLDFSQLTKLKNI